MGKSELPLPPLSGFPSLGDGSSSPVAPPVPAGAWGLRAAAAKIAAARGAPKDSEGAPAASPAAAAGAAAAAVETLKPAEGASQDPQPPPPAPPSSPKPPEEASPTAAATAAAVAVAAASAAPAAAAADAGPAESSASAAESSAREDSRTPAAPASPTPTSSSSSNSSSSNSSSNSSSSNSSSSSGDQPASPLPPSAWCPELPPSTPSSSDAPSSSSDAPSSSSDAPSSSSDAPGSSSDAPSSSSTPSSSSSSSEASLRHFLSPLSREQLLDLLSWAALRDGAVYRHCADRVHASPASRRLMVRNVHFCTSDERFLAFFRTFGCVADALIVRERDGQSRGYGFVTFAFPEGVSRCFVACPLTLDGRQLQVKLAADLFAAKDQTKLFVRNLHDQTTSETLRRVFGVFGALQECVVVRDAEGRSRGFGFLNFSTPMEAFKAVQMSERIIDGRMVF
ncbi:hypothetical protein, conserved, partial [Eimeria tenella]